MNRLEDVRRIILGDGLPAPIISEPPPPPSPRRHVDSMVALRPWDCVLVRLLWRGNSRLVTMRAVQAPRDDEIEVLRALLQAKMEQAHPKFGFEADEPTQISLKLLNLGHHPRQKRAPGIQQPQDPPDSSTLPRTVSSHSPRSSPRSSRRNSVKYREAPAIPPLECLEPYMLLSTSEATDEVTEAVQRVEKKMEAEKEQLLLLECAAVRSTPAPAAQKAQFSHSAPVTPRPPASFRRPTSARPARHWRPENSQTGFQSPRPWSAPVSARAAPTHTASTHRRTSRWASDGDGFALKNDAGDEVGQTTAVGSNRGHRPCGTQTYASSSSSSEAKEHDILQDTSDPTTRATERKDSMVPCEAAEKEVPIRGKQEMNSAQPIPSKYDNPDRDADRPLRPSPRQYGGLLQPSPSNEKRKEKRKDATKVVYSSQQRCWLIWGYTPRKSPSVADIAVSS